MSNLMATLSDELIASHPLLLRPADAKQKALMIESVISARKDTWRKGGYIFVTRQDAADVIQMLAQHQIAYEIFGISSIHELALLRSFTSVLDDERVIVYVDDENIAATRRTEDFKRFQSKVIEHCRKWDEEPAPASWRFLPVFYVDINLPVISGFAHRMRQASKQFGTFVLSSKNAFDREVDQRINSSRDSDEPKSIAANSVCIYGGGRRNHPEIEAALSSQPALEAPDSAGTQIYQEDIDKMKGETIFALVAGLSSARVIRLVE